MRVLVFGGDGYLGWPQAMYLSRKGFEVAVFDNMARRKFDLDEGFDSLLPIETLHRRAPAILLITKRFRAPFRNSNRKQWFTLLSSVPRRIP
jgi:UDP-sulfoquinovose synthase